MDDEHRILTGKTPINQTALLTMIPLSERAIDNMEKRGAFPCRIALTGHNVAWDLAGVEESTESRKRSEAQADRSGATAVTR